MLNTEMDIIREGRVLRNDIVGGGKKSKIAEKLIMLYIYTPLL